MIIAILVFSLINFKTRPISNNDTMIIDTIVIKSLSIPISASVVPAKIRLTKNSCIPNHKAIPFFPASVPESNVTCRFVLVELSKFSLSIASVNTSSIQLNISFIGSAKPVLSSA